MYELEIIRGPRGQVVKKTRDEFTSLIGVFNSGVQLMVDSNHLLGSESKALNHKTQEGSSKIAVWRFLSTLPISLTWCYDTALCGDYGISKNILRLSLEETVKLAYYSQFPAAAHRQMVVSRDTDEVKIFEMLKKLDISAKKEIIKLYGNLSNYYVHANLNIPPELVYEDDGEVAIGGGSRYIPDLFSGIVKQLILLNANSFKYIINSFPNLINEHDFMIRLNEYLISVLNLKIVVDEVNLS